MICGHHNIIITTASEDLALLLKLFVFLAKLDQDIPVSPEREFTKPKHAKKKQPIIKITKKTVPTLDTQNEKTA